MPLKKKRLGDILTENCLLTEKDIKKALDDKKKGERLGHTLTRLNLISEEKIAQALSKQTGVKRLDKSKLDEKIIKYYVDKLGKDMIYDLEIIPAYKHKNYLIIGVVDPLDITLADKIKKKIDLEIIERVVTNSEIEDILQSYYTSTKDFDSLVKDLDLKNKDEKNLKKLNNLEEDSAPIIDLVNKIINEGLKLKASDIHIEPMENKLRVRYRIDGILHEKTNLPKEILSPIVLRIKIMSSLDISNQLEPQDGKISLKFGKKNIDFRISILPSTNGEKVVIRILDKGNVSLDFNSLGFLNKDLQKIKKIIKNPHGMILATGPTGSGKTTTLYTILKNLNNIDKNIITIEDPVEYQLKGITQVQTNKNLTFADGLRSIVRQDPDIIMVGEIRDKETAQIAVQAALTGHLVLSTLHTNTAVGTISRLINMGVEPFLVSSSLIGVISQRLVRTLCDNCKTKVKENENIYFSYQQLLKKRNIENEKIKLYKNIGCSDCNQIGYNGRTAIHEILTFDSKLKEMIAKNKSLGILRKRAKKTGMTTLEENAIEKTNLGITSFNEIQKTTTL